jgi:hypothetical protein
MNITDHHHATTRHRSLQAKILPAICRPTSVPHPPWVPPSFSSHNLQKIKQKSQQASHHIPDLQITAHKSAISVSNFNPKQKQKQKSSLPPSLTHSKCGEVWLRQKRGPTKRQLRTHSKGERTIWHWAPYPTAIFIMMMMQRRSAHDTQREVQTSASKNTAYTSTQGRAPAMFSMWPCKIKIATTPHPPRPGPVRPGTAQAGAILLHRSSSSSGVLMTGLLFVCE